MPRTAPAPERNATHRWVRVHHDWPGHTSSVALEGVQVVLRDEYRAEGFTKRYACTAHAFASGCFHDIIIRDHGREVVDGLLEALTSMDLFAEPGQTPQRVEVGAPLPWATPDLKVTRQSTTTQKSSPAQPARATRPASRASQPGRGEAALTSQKSGSRKQARRKRRRDAKQEAAPKPSPQRLFEEESEAKLTAFRREAARAIFSRLSSEPGDEHRHAVVIRRR